MFNTAKMVAIVKEIDAMYSQTPPCPIVRSELAEIYSEDIELHFPYGLPAAIGIDEVIQRILLEQSLFEHFELDVSEPIVAGDTVVTNISGTMRDRSNDDFVGFQAVELSKFNHDGKICHKTLYLDLEALEHILGKDKMANLITNAMK